MSDKQAEAELLKSMRSAREEYAHVAKSYDAILARAHQSEHGSPEMVRALSEANAIGPVITEALRRYRDAISALHTFYSG